MIHKFAPHPLHCSEAPKTARGLLVEALLREARCEERPRGARNVWRELEVSPSAAKTNLKSSAQGQSRWV